ncbi:hypothetical protein HYN59_14515 [Flavobacterium album]|uniref:Ankyrin repeat domain-containing protein n=1 Tax=Flavobacterium album TaxID=2175091 RepID=A0A2S1R0Q5_9FLAO|nr:ankyrin repeat domain-containing protein [Flavobacterium album]AWH86248.1 hypothetical protein HYN59_14515 [Flavobacterium album]
MAKMTPENAQSILKKHTIEADAKHLADAYDNIELFEALLAAGADPNYMVEGSTPLFMDAYGRSKYFPFKLLMEYGADPNRPYKNDPKSPNVIFDMASTSGPGMFFWPMLEAGLELNAFHPVTGENLVTYMVRQPYSSVDVLKNLLENGADPNLPNKNGFTIYELLAQNKIRTRKPEFFLLKKYEKGGRELPPIPEGIISPVKKPILKISYEDSISSWRALEVLGKDVDSLTVRMYNLYFYDTEFPRSHTAALNIVFSLLERAKTPSQWQDIATVFEYDKHHIDVARKYIRSFEVYDVNAVHSNDLWKDTQLYKFDEVTDDMREKLMHATMTIRVSDPEMLETIEPGTWMNIPYRSASPFWYLENKDAGTFFALFKSEGGKWMSREGEIGTDGKLKPVAGISKGYYKEENNRAEAFAFGKKEAGYELVYKNYDTAYNIEEEIRNGKAEEKINENKANYSEEAIAAIQNEDVAKLRSILATGVHPDTLKTSYGKLATEYVADKYRTTQKHAEMLQLLLDHGADINHKEYDHPLLQQVCSGHAKNEASDEMVRCLIAAGADIFANSKSKGYHKSSVLQSACYGGMLWFVAYLLEKGVPVDYKDTEGMTALNYAVLSDRNSAAIIDVLLKNGADKNDFLTLSPHGSTSLENAEIPETIEKIISLGFDINMKNSHGYPGLFRAAEYGTAEIFETYLNLGAGVDLPNVLNRVNYRLHDKGSKQQSVEVSLKKLRMLHQRGYDITAGTTTFTWTYQSYEGRKKITKFEEQVLLDLWEMGCRPSWKKTFLEYVKRVNSTKLIALAETLPEHRVS